MCLKFDLRCNQCDAGFMSDDMEAETCQSCETELAEDLPLLPAPLFFNGENVICRECSRWIMPHWQRVHTSCTCDGCGRSNETL